MTRAALRARSDYRHWTRLTTRWHDNDIYGHVNNMVHYGWFDTAVNGWLVGAGRLDTKTGNPIGLVVETGCRYAAPLSFPQDIEIGLAAGHIGRSSVTYHLGAFAKGAIQAAAEGHFTHAYVDRFSRKSVPLPSDWRPILERLI